MMHLAFETKLNLKMAAGRVRNVNWKDDEKLKEELANYVRIGLRRNGILSFMERDYEEYAWSIRTLSRRMCHFGISYIDTEVPLQDVQTAVKNELDGPGRLLGYRAMHTKLRQEYHLNVLRNLVHDVMFDADPDLLETRRPNAKKKKPKGNFTTKDTNFVHSVDGHDKLMGFQNHTFPLAIYGAIDTASRKILWLKLWVSNSDPKRIGKWYIEYLSSTKQMASFMWMDKGTETGVLATINAYLREQHGDIEPSETIIYGPSTSNQVNIHNLYMYTNAQWGIDSMKCIITKYFENL